ncbi:26S proteasome regulatory subunit rpn6 [Serendipita sp. 396]|nr:26S proteasome regulatory subunit rpn6 [Serendipita sp. 396]KAG8787912.1 26S proteasome regulatory subunit rpn6 [Serendipita sp. 397]KAG8825517.1 26S proteasome regulatory subunit rpn6 [Serendipita sp. 401]KAG8870129.1 26S proteasome regulatory subunit rpn6 [Serendipita sp. 405]KAG9056400.1 26S proteasome regulatory subunit rpn6 [Serendipita sp. 407]
MSTDTSSLLSQAVSQRSSNPRQAEKLFKQILSVKAAENDVDVTRDQETALVELGELYRDEGNAVELEKVLLMAREITSTTAKAKTAKLILQLVNLFSTLPLASSKTTNSSVPTLQSVLTSSIEWARSTHRLFLAQSLSLRLASAHLSTHAYRPALNLVNTLLPELKRLDDKLLLAEVHLLESRVYQSLKNLPKAKAALTSARTAANAIYCPPNAQARLDVQSGILHAEDGDWKTSYSYFFEAFEGLSNLVENDRGRASSGSGGNDVGVAGAGVGAITALKYMLLCKIMMNLPEDVTTLLSGKLAAKYATHREVESMKAVARAHANRNLKEFRAALRDYKEEFSTDPIIRQHLSALFDRLLEQNLLRIVEPYSVVEIAHVAKLVDQGIQQVETKLSQMILDKVLDGVLDQGRGCLLLFDQADNDEGYADAIKMIDEVGKVVESLYSKAMTIA